MFLATTALSQYWDEEQSILFLGAWCLLHEKRSEWESLDHSVLPRVWDDPQIFDEATTYLDQLYEELIQELTKYLNNIHGVSHQPRYWRILLGPWVRRYLHMVYDRYAYLVRAFEQHSDLETYVLDPADHQTPEDTAGFSQLARLDEYNLMICSQILHAQGRGFPARRLENGWPVTTGATAPRRRSISRNILRSGKRVFNYVTERATSVLIGTRPIALSGMYLPPSETWKLALRSRFAAAPLNVKRTWNSPVVGPVMDSKRTGLTSLIKKDDFSRVFSQLLPANFPTLFLEGYQKARESTLKNHRKFPQVLTSLTGWYFDEPFKLLAAEASERGSRLVASQHGGAYGILDTVPEESHESSLSDAYIVWGWANNRSGPEINLPSPKLSSSIGIYGENGKSTAKEGVLLVTITGPRYLLKFISCPSDSQMEDYFDWEIRFLEAGSQAMLRKIIFRPLPSDYGWDLKKRVTERISEVIWDDGTPFQDRLKNSRVAVIDNPVTTFLEALVANVPTILFWDPERWRFREEALPHFETLRQAGILWDSPEEAAAKLESVYDDPWAWWGSKVVQETRKNFVSRYALTSKDWAGHWAKALKEQSKLYQASHA